MTDQELAKCKKEFKEHIEQYKSKGYFKGKNIIITGATGGIGSLTVQAFYDLGANVLALVRNKQKFLLKFSKVNYPDLKVEQLPSFDERGIYPQDLENFLYQLGGKIDVLIMCHGKYFNGDFESTKIIDFDQSLNINTRSCVNLLSLMTPFLKLSKGNVVIVSSLEAFIPIKSSLLNTVTKSMINSLIQCTALELASFGVRVNGVAPGITHTSFRVGVNDDFKESNNNQLMEMVGKNNLLLSKPIYPENVVDSIMFLASDEAAFMTGEILQVDDGFGLNHDFNFSAET